ncbi:MAG: DUF1648 domain-containing protein [Armatimonadetes bacterium]|nr:DUF1648 domain-containing protein [Armatimonadota bacterium]
MSEARRWSDWLPALPLALGVLILLVLYPGLRPEVALHFDANGAVDHVGPRAQLLTLPLMAVIFDLVMLMRAKVALSTPETLRVPVAVTEANREQVAVLYARWMTALRWSANSTLGLAMVLEAASARLERHLISPLWVLPCVLVVVIFSARYLRAMKRA